MSQVPSSQSNGSCIRRNSTGSPMLLVIGSGPRPMRSYLLEQTAAHYPLLLINDAPLTWQKPYVSTTRWPI